MKNYFLLIAVSAILSGCVTGMPNQVSTATSSFDGSTEISLEPGFVYENKNLMSQGTFMLGLHWSSSEKDFVFIKAEKPGRIVSLAKEDGLQFNIDGEIIKLSSPQALTNTDVSRYYSQFFTQSARGYLAKVELLRRIVNAKDVKVKLVTAEGYYEGDLLTDKPGSAITGFREFIAKLDGQELPAERSK